MTPVKYLLSFLVAATSLCAQTFNHAVMASGNDVRTIPRQFSTTVDTIHLLAALVQFQIDNDAGTSGNGQFDLSTPATPGLDAPPRNRQYFLDHLTFLANYYQKVSKGKVVLRATLVDSVFTLGSQMSRYSPPKSGPNTVVGDLAVDTWRKVDSSGLVQDFSLYDCFVLFHAGVGRDVDVVAAVGFDPTPRDIPSLYLGLNAFKGFYGAAYEGIPVRNGFKITNTIIMPETETRELPATPANVVLTLGINGLLCASVGNFLGLPDLFDTNTGRSGIGRFGLMDGQAIFSFRGAFPPEPSAWEKYWLGWIEPIGVPSGTSVLALPAASVDSARVYRVPISASEYFLIENRNRDAERNGQRVTSVYGGTVRTQSFARDTAGFDASDISAIRGNIIEVEDFDWSLPGGVNTAGTFFDGGILIWHIDETEIARGLATNSVNANPNRRGVDVEEADGSQDIGQAYGLLEPGSGSEEGTALDFWYQGNASPANRNEFSSRTYPNTNSNSGAYSHITIKDFSLRSARMTAKVILGDNVTPIVGFPKALPNRMQDISLTVADAGGAFGTSIFVTTSEATAQRPGNTTNNRSRIYAWKLDGAGLVRSDGAFAEMPTAGSTFLNLVAARDLNQDGVAEIVTGTFFHGIVPEYAIRAFSISPQAPDSLATIYFSQTVSRVVTTPPVVSDSIIAFGTENGNLIALRFDGSIVDSTQRVSSTISGIASKLHADAFVVTTTGGTIAIRPSQGVGDPQFSRTLGTTIAGSAVTGTFASRERIACATTDGSVYLFDEFLNTIQGFPVHVDGSIRHSPALADIDGDGIRDIVVFAGRRIYAFNYAGAALDNFPKLVSSDQAITSYPVVADVDGDGDVDVVAVTRDGLVVAYDKKGTLASGFPLQAGTGNQSVAAFSYSPPASQIVQQGLFVASSDDGSMAGWWTGSSGPVQQQLRGSTWLQFQNNAQHSGTAPEALTGSPLSTAFFPKERAYNWPNPVYDGRTFIRYFVSEHATVKIKIFDLAGDLVTELNGPGIAGVDNEVEWNVHDVQSGVYLARIEANGSGKSETAIVKVAVVK